MELYIIRHAWAEAPGDPAWPDDAQRPLTEEGRERFARMADLLAPRGFAPTMLATSPLVRCVQTAEIVVQCAGGQAEIVEREELLPGGDVESLLDWTEKQSRRHEQIAWIGHAPDVGEFAAATLGDRRAEIRFSKGAIAAIRFDGRPRAGEGELRWMITAKILGC